LHPLLAPLTEAQRDAVSHVDGPLLIVAGPGSGKTRVISTFHRFCARLMRQYGRSVGLAENYSIYDTSDSRSALKRAMQSLDLEQARFTPERIAAAISWAKNNLVGPEQYEPRRCARA